MDGCRAAEMAAEAPSAPASTCATCSTAPDTPGSAARAAASSCARAFMTSSPSTTFTAVASFQGVSSLSTSVKPRPQPKEVSSCARGSSSARAGARIVGTPARSAASKLPEPPCVTVHEQCGSSQACGAPRRKSTLRSANAARAGSSSSERASWNALWSRRGQLETRMPRRRAILRAFTASVTRAFGPFACRPLPQSMQTGGLSASVMKRRASSRALGPPKK
mmetsp:Transcript_86262/g.252323  ORF Transcript_86262/g.252323 Transcript_86262/m.252323 type:complete len:222 (-) Transcript_86262:710-1375(-)